MDSTDEAKDLERELIYGNFSSVPSPPSILLTVDSARFGWGEGALVSSMGVSPLESGLEGFATLTTSSGEESLFSVSLGMDGNGPVGLSIDDEIWDCVLTAHNSTQTAMRFPLPYWLFTLEW